MTEHDKEILSQLSKEQLIYLIEQLNYSQFLISETCVDESKCNIGSDKAIDKIRGYIYQMPNMYNVEELKSYIDMKINKISAKEYRKIIGLDD